MQSLYCACKNGITAIQVNIICCIKEKLTTPGIFPGCSHADRSFGVGNEVCNNPMERQLQGFFGLIVQKCHDKDNKAVKSCSWHLSKWLPHNLSFKNP